ncbi:MAG TPA: MauE/DoxX family redox-associated membrane protein [Actinomycetota bacterium]|nr:MauE/DoxX family redox-associated membrane protein [Actinomycetota bacterium]
MGGFEHAQALAGDLVDALVGAEGQAVTRWFLVAMFGVAGVTKLRRPMLAAMAMVDFGVVRRPRRELGLALGAAEVLVALAVAIPVTSGAGRWVAAGLLWAFVAVTVRALATKRDVACFCLGDPDARITHWSGVRTGGLALLVSLQLAEPGTAPSAQPTDELMFAVAACACFAIALVAARVPRLLKWNAGTVNFVEEEPA